MTNPVGYEGEPLTLADGRQVHLRYGMRSLMLLEDRFGSLAQMEDALGQAQAADGSTPTGAVFRPMLTLIGCGLHGQHDGQGRPLTDPEVLADVLDVTRLQDAVQSATKALQAAFPSPPVAGPAQPQPAVQPQAPLSPGPTGTTSAPSPSAAPTTSS